MYVDDVEADAMSSTAAQRNRAVRQYAEVGTEVQVDIPYYNLYIGYKSYGFLKGVNFAKRILKTIHQEPSLLNQDIDTFKGCICDMCWGDNRETSLYTVTRSGILRHYDFINGCSTALSMPGPSPIAHKSGVVNIREHEDKLFLAQMNGSLTVLNVKKQLSQPRSVDIICQMNVLQNNGMVRSMDHNTSETNQVLTAGIARLNPLKVWDIQKQACLFKSNSVDYSYSNDNKTAEILKAIFCPNSSRIIALSSCGKIQLYDPLSPHRQPVLSINFRGLKYQSLTALDYRPNSDFEVICGNTGGVLQMVDFRMEKISRQYARCSGSVTDIKCHPVYPVFVAVSDEGHLNCYDMDKSTSNYPNLIHAFQLAKPAESILFSSNWERDDYGPTE